MPLYPMKNRLQHYAWGSKSAIPRLLGIEDSSGKPVAELWMGAHPDAPSLVDLPDGEASLGELIARDPATLLGSRTVDRFGSQLPFLFKLLAAETALSIQAHPSQRDAAEGFARENSAGLAADDPARNYKDPNHKPEILCALEPFWGMCGFRTVGQIEYELGTAEMRLSAAEPLRAALRSSSDEAAAQLAFLRTLLTQTASQTARLVAAATELAQSHAAQADATVPAARYRWLITLASQYPGDVGVLAPLFMQLFRLDPGESIFLGAGTLHAYLHGCGIELMANSNNVLRGGLTGKRIDVAELLRIVDGGAGGPQISRDVRPEPLRGRGGAVAGKRFRYAAPVSEFRLERIVIDGAEPVTNQPDDLPRIVLCLGGKATFSTATSSHAVGRGRSLFVPANESAYSVSGPAELYLATVGL